MQITDMLLTNKNARPGTKIIPKGLALHWTANEGRGANALANRNYFNNPTTEASAHYIVDDKQIIRCLPETEMGYHVGAKTYKPDALAKLSPYPNNCTIGIEMCVNQDGDFKAMYQRTVALAADILKHYGWGVDKLWRHYDITGKNCPAYFVSDDKAKQYTGLTALQAWEKFKQDVQCTIKGRANVDKPVENRQEGLKLEDWERDAGLQAIDRLATKGLLNDPDEWKRRLTDDPQGVLSELPWLFFTLLDRVTET